MTGKYPRTELTHSLYSNRPLSHGYPELEKQAVASFTGEEVESRVAEIMTCLARLVDLPKGPQSVTVIGCGPNPQSIKDLIALRVRRQRHRAGGGLRREGWAGAR